MNALAERLSGDLMGGTFREEQARPGGVTPNAPDRVLYGPLRPAPPPDASLADLDRAIAQRRKELSDLDTTIETLETRLAEPPLSRLKALLLGKRDDRLDLIRERDAAVIMRGEVTAELDELGNARRPYEAVGAAYDYDQKIRPPLWADLRALASHLTAARAIFETHGDLHWQAGQALAASLVRSMTSCRLTGNDVAEIDRRELDLLTAWRSAVTGPDSRLARWLRDVATAGVDLSKGGK